MMHFIVYAVATALSLGIALYVVVWALPALLEYWMPPPTDCRDLLAPSSPVCEPASVSPATRLAQAGPFEKVGFRVARQGKHL